jgi:chemotaxis protein CheD
MISVERGAQAIVYSFAAWDRWFLMDNERIGEIVDVQMGQVRAVRGQVIVKSGAIGSCIVVVVYDPSNKTAAVAHIMLPGRAPAGKSSDEKTKYAHDAIDAIIDKMTRFGSTAPNIKAAVLGGANVLQKDDDTICQANIDSALDYLAERHLEVVATAVGGTRRRNVWLDVDSGVIDYTEGDSDKRQLWCSQ